MSETWGVGEFLFNEELSRRIREVTSGRGVCCAIAFWSKNGIEEIFPGGVPVDAKIVCDISMGSTSADALSALGGPGNKRLRHKIGMHAKVCLSNKGLIVSSANASHAAMGSGGESGRHLEAGMFHAADSGAWKAAEAWFESLFHNALPVGLDEIAWAKLVYRPRIDKVRRQPPSDGSLLDLVLAVPEKFERIGFVFSKNQTTEKERAEVRNHAKKIDPQGPDHVKSLPNSGIFYDWNTADVRRWPSYFVEFWQPNQALYVFGRRLEIRLPEIGSIMSIGDWKGLRAVTDTELPPAQKIAKADAVLAKRVRGDEGGVFFASGCDLYRFIVERMAKPGAQRLVHGDAERPVGGSPDGRLRSKRRDG
jgi:hypothetical protein